MFLAVALALVVAEPLPPGAVARLGTARIRHSDGVRDAAFSPDGTRLAVTTDDGLVWVWGAASGRFVGKVEVGRYAGVAFSANGRDVGTFASGVGLRVFDPRTGTVTRTDTQLKIGGPYAVAAGRQPAPVLAPGLRSMAFRTGEGAGCKVVVVDPATGREVTTLPLRHNGWVTWVADSADGHRLAVADGESARCTVWVFDPATGQVAFEQRVEGLYPSGVSLSRDGARVAASLKLHNGPAKPAVKVWDTATGKVLLDRPVNSWLLRESALAPDGKTVAVLEGRTITLVDVGTAAVRRTLETRGEYGRLFYSPDGRSLAVASGYAVEVFDTATGWVVPGRDETFDPNVNTIHAGGWLRFRPDGKVLARLADEPGPSVWDPLTGRRVESIELPPGVPGRAAVDLFRGDVRGGPRRVPRVGPGAEGRCRQVHVPERGRPAVRLHIGRAATVLAHGVPHDVRQGVVGTRPGHAGVGRSRRVPGRAVLSR
jgi:WD40 repeat protein